MLLFCNHLCTVIFAKYFSCFDATEIKKIKNLKKLFRYKFFQKLFREISKKLHLCLLKILMKTYKNAGSMSRENRERPKMKVKLIQYIFKIRSTKCMNQKDFWGFNAFFEFYCHLINY